MQEIRYALWIMLSKDAAKKFSKIILEISKEYRSPAFEPHITLIIIKSMNEKEAIKKSRVLIESLRPFEIFLDKIDFLDTYFRCLFVKAKKTKDLMGANKKAQKIFNVKDDYMPHLSLMYGNFPEETKRKIIKHIGEKIEENFITKEIRLINCESPDTKDWNTVKIFRLK